MLEIWSLSIPNKLEMKFFYFGGFVCLFEFTGKEYVHTRNLYRPLAATHSRQSLMSGQY